MRLSCASLFPLLLLSWRLERANAFSISRHNHGGSNRNRPLVQVRFTASAPHSTGFITSTSTSKTLLRLSDQEQQELNDSFNQLSEEGKKQAVGNLVADDEWNGLTMELSELVRLAILEDMKKNTRDFLGKDSYEVGDISKEIDDRVKTEVAKIRGKEEYQLGDFVMAMDEMSKSMTEELTGKEYETGDLSKELDKRIKEKVAAFAGEDTYEFGMLSKAIDERVKAKVEEFTGKPYEFGDITAELDKRRQAWVKEFLGDEAAEKYQFGDITKKAVSNFTGKEEYQFGDVSKKIIGDLFGGKKKKKGD